MNRRITIRATTRTPDGGGGWAESPVDVATVWARVEGLDGRELIQAMQTEMQRPFRFTIWYRPDVTGANTILYDGRTFDIRSVVDPGEKHRELHILAEEIV
jgi:SPP1 family predicted phage head-tail adaptor